MARFAQRDVGYYLTTYIPFCLVASSYRGRAGLIAYQAQGSRAGWDLIEAGILIKLYSLWSLFLESSGFRG